MLTPPTDWVVLSNRLLLLQELMVGLSNLKVDEVLSRAAEGVGWVFDEAELHAVAPEQLLPPPLAPRGRVRTADYGEVYLAYFGGPPEPRYLLLAKLELLDPQEFRLAALFCEHLVAALTAAGYREELARQAQTDWLTGLPNRRSFEVFGQQGEVQVPALLGVLECRHLPGEADSDLLLKKLAHTLKAALPKSAYAFRTGAFRITVLLPEEARAPLEKALERAGLEVSAGWAGGRGEAEGMDDHLERATARLEAVLGGVWRSPTSPPSSPRFSAGPEAAHPAPLVRVCSALEQVRSVYQERVSPLSLAGPVTLVLDGPYGYAFDFLSAAEVSSEVPRPVLLLSENPSPAYLRDLLRLAAEGLVIGQTDDQTLFAALERVAAGERFYRGPPLEDDALFPREREVWRLVVRGLSNAQIAQKLRVREKTVANYVTNLQDKLHLTNRVELVLSYLGKLEP